MARQALLLVATVAIFGVFVPWLKGFAFLDPLIILCYACLGVVYVAPAAAEAFGRKTASSTKSAVLMKMASILAYGWGVSILMLASGILTVNVANWHGRFIGPRPQLLLAAVVLSGAACAAVIAFSGMLAVAYGPKAAKTVLRFAFLLLLLGTAFGYRYLSEDTRFQLELIMTTSGLTRLAFQSAAILAAISATVTAWWIARVRPN